MITLDLQFFGGRGASSGGISQSDLAKYGDKLAERFKRYDVGDATIFKVGDNYAIYDLKRPPRTGKMADTLVETVPTLKQAKAEAEKLSNLINKEQKATNARVIDRMNEAQLDNEIKNAKADIARAEKTMGKNTIVGEEAKAMQKAFPVGVGGDGWSEARKKARDKGLERDVKKAKAYTEAYSQKAAAESRLKALEDAKKAVKGTGKTLNQISEEKAKKAVKETAKTMTWKTTQKSGWNNGAYKPKIIKSGNMEIHGDDGYYSIYKDGKLLGHTDKLSKAKAYAERKK